ncbi:MAG: SHOCT domain-containing protein [Chloroflexota bacterium]
MQGRDVAVVAGAVLLVVLFFTLLGGGMMGPGMMGWPLGGSGFGMWGGLVMLAFWALLIGGMTLLGVWLLRQWSPAGQSPEPRGGRALEILKERYARGEITRDEYEQMRRDLDQT